MARRDVYTNTETDAGHFDQLQSYADDHRDYDIPSVVSSLPSHLCRTPDPTRCFVCAIDEQEQMVKVRAEVTRERNKEWYR